MARRRWDTNMLASSNRSPQASTTHRSLGLRRRLVRRVGQHLRNLRGGLSVSLYPPGHDGLATVSEYARIPLADGTLVPVHGEPTERQARSLLAASDVLGTGWFAAVAAEAGPGKTVPACLVGDGAVGLLAILAARQLGAERIIAMSRHADRQADPPRNSAPPTSSKSGATRASRRSRNSPAAMAPTLPSKP